MKKKPPRLTARHAESGRRLVLQASDDADLPPLRVIVPVETLRRLAKKADMVGPNRAKALQSVFEAGVREGAEKPYVSPDLLEVWGMARVFDFLKQGPSWKTKHPDAQIAQGKQKGASYPKVSFPAFHETGNEQKNERLLESLVQEINNRLSALSLPTVNVTTSCPLARYDHGRCGRVFAHTLHHPQTICLDRSLLRLPSRFVTGVLLHEAGHLVADEVWGDDSEEAADLAALVFLGAQIGYEAPWWIQSLRPEAWQTWLSSPRRQKNPDFPPLSLERMRPWAVAMEEQGVSEVARSERGFWTQYEAAGGDLRLLSPWWQMRRENFLLRHEAQRAKRREPLYTKEGLPTRRHLALVAWAYSPDPKGLAAREKKRSANPLSALQTKAREWGVPLWVLEEVFARGIRQFRRSKEIPGNAYQWAMTRVNRFLEGGKGSTRLGADADLFQKAQKPNGDLQPHDP